MREGPFVLVAAIGVITLAASQEARCPPGTKKAGSHCYDRDELAPSEAGVPPFNEVDGGSQPTFDSGQPGVRGKHDGGSPSEEAGAAPATCSTEVCDNVDNDCDGVTDEAGASDAKSWFQDCDLDGYAPSAEDPIEACSTPEPIGSCGWTAVRPQPETKSNWDCDDSSDAYRPDADFGPDGKSSFDLDCDGTTEPKSGAKAATPAGLRPDHT